MEKTKILICTPLYPPDIGGPATYSRILEEELPKRGIEIDILKFSEARHLPKLMRHFAYFIKVLKLGRKADIVFALDPVSVGLPSCLAAKILRKKFLIKIAGDYAWEQYQQIQNSKIKNQNDNSKFKSLENFQNEKLDFITELRRRVERWVAKKAEKIIVPSEYLKKIILMWGVEADKIKVIYNAFSAPEADVSKEEARGSLISASKPDFLLISAGRLVPWKGFKALIEIMPQITEEIPGVKLYIIGEGPGKEALKSQILNLKLENNVFLTGQLPRDEVSAYLKAGDVFVLNTGYEGLSHQILEAMAAGIPVVATNVGGNPELIKNNESGFLVEYNNAVELKKAIVELRQNRELGLKFSRKGKEKAEEFNKEKMISNLASFLNNEFQQKHF